MEQILHANSRTTEAIRKEKRNCKESIIKIAKRFNINPKTVVKWRKREDVKDLPMEAKKIKSKVLSEAEEESIVAYLMAYNFAKRLKAIKGNTPWQFILKQWIDYPQYFIINPNHY